MARKSKAPDGCYWRNDTLWGRVRIGKHDIRRPLHTSDPKVARARRQALKDRIVADRYHGDAPRLFVEALEGWAPWIKRKVKSAKTVQRYACSLGQLKDFLEGKRLDQIDARLVADIVRARTADGVSNATIKRDLVALSSVINYAISETWIDANPVLARMALVEEPREPILLPRQEDIDAVIAAAPGMVKDLIRAAMATGARQDELLRARLDDIDHQRQTLTVLGKRNKRRTISLEPFAGYPQLAALPAYVGKPLLFWHGAGEPYRNFASQFAAIVRRVAESAGSDFRPFRFHDLRHWHAVHWLKSGRSIYELKDRLGHTSVKTTEMYLEAGYLSFEEKQAVMFGTARAQKRAHGPVEGTAAG